MRTIRCGGPAALAAAIAGRVPAYGYHLDENRRGQFLVHVETALSDIATYLAKRECNGEGIRFQEP